MNLSDKLTGRKSYEQYFSKMATMFDRPAAKATGLVSLTIFTVVFFSVFAIIPTFKTIGALTKEIEDTKNIEAKLQQKIHSLEQAEALYSQVLPKLTRLDRVLPPEPDFERFAWQLYWLANKNQVSLTSGSFDEFPFRGQSESGRDLNGLEVNLSIQGNYLNLKNFIADLSRLDRLTQIDQITLSNKSIKNLGKGLSANLKLKAFYQPL